MFARSSRFPRILTVPLTLLATTAFGQTESERTTVLETSLAKATAADAPFAVSRIDPDGTAQLGVIAAVPAADRRALTGSTQEGYHLMIVVPSGKPSAQPVVLRAQVTDVAEGPSLTVRLAPEAATRVRPGDRVRLVRPLGSTTAVLRRLPGVIPISGDVAAAAAQARQRARSVDNLVRIGRALHAYHASRGEFPPAVIYGAEGKPWHSWRALILHDLGEDDLHRSYDLEQPWDSPKNRKLLDRMPEVYREPAYGETKESFAHYAALTGTNTCFPSDKPGKLEATPFFDAFGNRRHGIGAQSFIDGMSNSIMVAPVESGRKIPWTKPEDIAVGPDFPALGKPGGIATPYTLGSKPGAVGVAPILYADGTVHLIAATIEQPALKALLTINGGEVINKRDVPEDSSAFGPATQVLKIRVAGDKVAATIGDAH